jgi:hypothetical protein
MKAIERKTTNAKIITLTAFENNPREKAKSDANKKLQKPCPEILSSADS